MNMKHEEDPRKRQWMKRRHFAVRLNVFFFCTFVLFSILVVRLAIMQFVETKELMALKNEQNEASNPIPPIRGNIYDREGAPLAYSTSTQSLFYRVQPQTKNEEFVELAKRLADIFAKYGEDGEETMTAEEIIKEMNVGVDLALNPTTITLYYNTPRRIKTDLSDEELAFFTEHRDEFKGIEIVEESIRHYTLNPDAPEGEEATIAAQLLGYLREFRVAQANPVSIYDVYRNPEEDVDYLQEEGVGLEGLEYMYQKELRGENGEKIYSINPMGQIVGDRVSIIPPVKGHNLFLTLDKDVQLAAENAIREHVVKLQKDPRYTSVNKTGVKATSGYAVAMEVSEQNMGKVIAMANYPSYDSNVWRGGISTETFAEISNKSLNGTIKGIPAHYEDDTERAKHPGSLVPLGSTIKPLTVLVGLDQGLITTESIYRDTGIFEFGRDDSRIRNSNSASYGSMDPSRAIEKSSNTFMAAMIGEPLYRRYGGEGGRSIEVWDEYMKQFGLGADTGSGLPNESRGSIDYTETSSTGSQLASMVFASFGQGGRYTTLQLAQFAATLATQGKRPKPQFVNRIETYDGNIVEQFEPEILNEVSFKQEHWDEVLDGMSKVYKMEFEDFPYTVGSKTGTSQQAVSGGLVENGIFIAFAPLDNPKLAVAVVVPEGGYGSAAAAPIARKIFDAYDEQYGLGDAPIGLIEATTP
ncbi:peptidoglycan D,D-transpeptidase FtsI family protein [Marinicrinis sediminis]|uniref:Peptidoglycan D,D-transpeptidase FtsI family protein n=1 Tax=Marinicrinis sediminis TaxID=1652465 RepID=A0ABW5R7Y4_9BACL